MTEAREISAERLAYIIARDVGGRKKNKECGCKPVDWQTEIADLLAHIAFQQAALEAANTRAEEAEAGRDLAERDGIQAEENALLSEREAETMATDAEKARVRATAAEAENARLREVLKKAHAHLCDGESVSAAIVVEAALAPAPAIAPPPAPAPEPSEVDAHDVVAALSSYVRCGDRSVIDQYTHDCRQEAQEALTRFIDQRIARALDALGGGRR